MGSGCIKQNDNMYFQSRKNAALYNDRLYSREGAAELLGLSVSSLADYELGITKCVPVDKVVLMAELYNAPELKASYCKNECPIGKNLPIATQQTELANVALSIIKAFDSKKVTEVQKTLVEIAEDGTISEDEIMAFQSVINFVDECIEAVSKLKLIGEKVLKG